jgi:hypothetical protein
MQASPSPYAVLGWAAFQVTLWLLAGAATLLVLSVGLVVGLGTITGLLI